MINKFLILIFSQLGLVTFLWLWTSNPHEESRDESFNTPPPSIVVVISRFICGLFLHISQEDEAKAAFKMMKYVTNHPWKFANWKFAFFTNFVQIIILILVEGVSIAVLLLQTSVLDVLMNFFALTIITELDDYYF